MNLLWTVLISIYDDSWWYIKISLIHIIKKKLITQKSKSLILLLYIINYILNLVTEPDRVLLWNAINGSPQTWQYLSIAH